MNWSWFIIHSSAVASLQNSLGNDDVVSCMVASSLACCQINLCQNGITQTYRCDADEQTPSKLARYDNGVFMSTPL